MLRKFLNIAIIIFLTTSCTTKLNLGNGDNKIAVKQHDKVVRFDFDSFEINKEFKRKIKNEFVKEIKSQPFKKIIIEGHADERGDTDYNYNLGMLRATTVKYQLMDNGIAADQIKVISYGETRPVAIGKNERSWSKNRRAAIIIK